MGTAKDSVYDKQIRQPNIEGSDDFFRNLAKKLPEEDQKRIVEEVITGFMNDFRSMSEVRERVRQVDELLDMVGAGQPNNSPFQGSANVYSPFLNTLINQNKSSLARNLLSAENLVNPIYLTEDLTDRLRGDKAALHQNYQYNYAFNFRKSFRVLIDITCRHGWGIRKIFWNPNLNRLVSDTVLPDDFVFNSNTRSLEKSERYTHRLRLTYNELLEREKQGIYINVDKLNSETQRIPELESIRDENEYNMGFDEPQLDFTKPREILESHVFIKLKTGDKYRSPFIVTVDMQDRTLLRLIRRESNGQPILYFQDYSWDPRPASLIGYGIGSLFFTQAHLINSLLNFFLNQAKLSSVISGFIAKGSSASGNIQASTGWFTELNARNSDLSKQIHQFDFKPPGSEYLSVIQEVKGESKAAISHSTMQEGNPLRDNVERPTLGEAQLVQQESKILQSYIENGFIESASLEFEKYRKTSAIFVDETNFETNAFPRIEVQNPETGEKEVQFIRPEDLTGEAATDGYKLTMNKQHASQEKTAIKLQSLDLMMAQDQILQTNIPLKKLVAEKKLKLLDLGDDIKDSVLGAYDAQQALQEQQAQQAPQQVAQQQLLNSIGGQQGGQKQ